MSYRLKTEIWVQAYLRHVTTQNAYGLVARRGDKDAGGLYVRVNTLSGCSALLTATSDIEGNRFWRVLANTKTPDNEIDAMLTREAKRDPDMWIIEIEDRAGRHFLTEPIEDTQI